MDVTFSKKKKVYIKLSSNFLVIELNRNKKKKKIAGINIDRRHSRDKILNYRRFAFGIACRIVNHFTRCDALC